MSMRLRLNQGTKTSRRCIMRDWIKKPMFRKFFLTSAPFPESLVPVCLPRTGFSSVMAAAGKTILIVSAFAEPQSTGGTLEQTLIQEARKAGCTVLSSNLYATHFNAVAFPQDFQPRKDVGYF